MNHKDFLFTINTAYKLDKLPDKKTEKIWRMMEEDITTDEAKEKITNEVRKLMDYVFFEEKLFQLMDNEEVTQWE